jgi:hypothetical protein
MRDYLLFIVKNALRSMALQTSTNVMHRFRHYLLAH